MIRHLIPVAVRVARRGWRPTAFGLRRAWLRASQDRVELSGRVRLHRRVRIEVAGESSLRIGDAEVGEDAYLAASNGGSLELDCFFIGRHSVIAAQERVTIGRGTGVAEYVIIRDSNHDSAHPLESMRYVTRPIVIGENVWIGAGAIILPGVTIGDDAIIAGGAIVTSDVRSGTTVAGVPARQIRDSGMAPRRGC